TKTLDFETVLKKLDDAGVPAGAIYNIEDIVNDAQYNARGMIQEFKLNDEEDIKIPGIIPKMSKTPGSTNWLGPELGEHTQNILANYLGMDEKNIQALKEKRII